MSERDSQGCIIGNSLTLLNRRSSGGRTGLHGIMKDTETGLVTSALINFEGSLGISCLVNTWKHITTTTLVPLAWIHDKGQNLSHLDFWLRQEIAVVSSLKKSHFLVALSHDTE